MPKLQLDKANVQGFFVRHVEKIVLVVVLLLFAVFVYTGYSVEGLPESRTPEHLQRLSKQVDDHIQKDTWENVAGEFQIDRGLQEQAKTTTVAMSELPYALSKPFMPSTARSGARRVDPELLPPFEVEATVLVAPVLYRKQAEDQDLLAEAKNTEPPKAPKKREKPIRMPRMNTGEGGGSGGGGGGGLTREQMQAMMTGKTGGDAGGTATGKVGGSTSSGVTAAGRNFPGYRPGFSTTSTIHKPKVIVAVKALVPYLQQWEVFERALADSMEYKPSRDIPKYLMFVAERAEVPSDPNAELQWKQITNTNHERGLLDSEAWPGNPQEVADARYLQPFVLTMPIPPIMMRELDLVALHSRVPRQAPASGGTQRGPVVEEADEPAAALASGGVASDVPGMGPAAQVAAKTAATTTAGGAPKAAEWEPEESAGSGSMAKGGLGREAMMRMMTGKTGGAGDEMGVGLAVDKPPPRPEVEHLMIRFFDFTAEPGKKYRYRVQLILEDPNRPQYPGSEPAERALDDAVKQRLTAVAQQEQTERRRIYYVRTKWSDPSEVATVESPRRTLAGEITPPRLVDVPNSGFQVPADEPTAEVMAIVWDQARAVDVPVVLDAPRGAYLNFTKNADVIHPVTLQFKQLEGVHVATDRLLVDFRGGQPLPSKEKKDKENGKKKDAAEAEEPLTAPSEFIFLDQEGNLVVRNDLEDEATFALYALPDAPRASSGSPPAEAGGGDMGGSGGSGGSGGRR